MILVRSVWFNTFQRRYMNQCFWTIFPTICHSAAALGKATVYSKTLSHASKPKLPQEKCYQIMDFHLDKIAIIVAFSAIISSFYWETCLKYMYDRNLDFANFLVTSGYTSRLKCASCASIISIENFPKKKKKNRQISTVEKLISLKI